MMTHVAPSPVRAVIGGAVAIRFVAGMPGLEHLTRFTLLGTDESPVYWLQSDQDYDFALPLADAAAVMPDYAFELSTPDVLALGLREPDDAFVLVVLTLSSGEDIITANLFAPIVVNRHTWAAKQVILENTDYSLRHPLTGM